LIYGVIKANGMPVPGTAIYFRWKTNTGKGNSWWRNGREEKGNLQNPLILRKGYQFE
jgi:hypothetical protein